MTRLSRRTAVAGLLATTFALPSVRARGLAGGSRELLLLDASLDAADHRATAALRATRRPRMVQADLVHQWRGGLQRELAAQAGTVTALVRWDKALLLSDLAREAGIRNCVTRLSRSVFKVELFV